MANSNMVAEWKTAKKEFEAVTGKSRPKESFLKIFSKGSGIEPALKKCDDLANSDSRASSKEKKATAAKLKTALADLMAKVKAYLELLDKGIAAEAGKTDMYRALKALRAKTDKFKPHYDYAIKEMETDALEMLTKGGAPMLRKVVANALADVQRVLAKPDVATYDAVMSGGNGAGRRLTTGLQMLGTDQDAVDTAAYKTQLNDFATAARCR